jgi:hypothetical protein
MGRSVKIVMHLFDICVSLAQLPFACKAAPVDHLQFTVLLVATKTELADSSNHKPTTPEKRTWHHGQKSHRLTTHGFFKSDVWQVVAPAIAKSVT